MAAAEAEYAVEEPKKVVWASKWWANSSGSTGFFHPAVADREADIVAVVRNLLTLARDEKRGLGAWKSWASIIIFKVFKEENVQLVAKKTAQAQGKEWFELIFSPNELKSVHLKSFRLGGDADVNLSRDWNIKDMFFTGRTTDEWAQVAENHR